jgi:hypothetical protein
VTNGIEKSDFCLTNEILSGGAVVTFSNQLKFPITIYFPGTRMNQNDLIASSCQRAFCVGQNVKSVQAKSMQSHHKTALGWVTVKRSDAQLRLDKPPIDAF